MRRLATAILVLGAIAAVVSSPARVVATGR